MVCFAANKNQSTKIFFTRKIEKRHKENSCYKWKIHVKNKEKKKIEKPFNTLPWLLGMVREITYLFKVITRLAQSIKSALHYGRYN